MFIVCGTSLHELLGAQIEDIKLQSPHTSQNVHQGAGQGKKKGGGEGERKGHITLPSA